jgi:phospholipase/carboxylesterase
MAFRPLDGPRLPPVKGPATSLVVLVHGYGADGNDLISLAQHWREMLPGTAFVSPHAPERVPGAPSGFQWFGLTRRDAQEWSQGVKTAGPGLAEFVGVEAARLGLGLERVALVGFSQGTMLSLEVGLNHPVAAIVGFSGLLAAPPPEGFAAPPILLAHGTADPVIPVSATLAAASVLGTAGARVQWHLAEGVGHGIDPAGLEIAGQFMALAFAGRLAADGPACCKVGP